MRRLKLGLIGDNIAASKAPILHRAAGQLAGIDVTYDRLVPADRDQDFETLFNQCSRDGYDGLNITYAYKETAAAWVTINNPLVGKMGAVNTVLFGDGPPRGFNTDHSGFVTAYGTNFDHAPGRVCLVGAGGVGKAVAFGLLKLGATIAIVDRVRQRAEALAEALRRSDSKLQVSAHADVMTAAAGADGLINCTPAGMVGYGGTALPEAALRGPRWAFDAVYTPVNTPFVEAARAAGLEVMTGYELFFHQGIDCFEIFSGHRLREPDLAQAMRRLEAQIETEGD